MSNNSVVLDDLQGLERLTEKGKKAIVKAFEIAAFYNSEHCEPIHLFLALLKLNDGVPMIVLNKLGVDLQKTIEQIEATLKESSKTGYKTQPQFSNTLKKIINDSYLVSQQISHVYVGTEHLLLAIMRNDDLEFVTELRKLGIDAHKVEEMILATGTYTSGLFTGSDDIEKDDEDGGQLSSLEYFGIDMNEQVRKGKYLPTLGREKEVSRLIHILARKTKNNPILVGDAGVGKTAIVEGFVQRIVSGEVPKSFVDKTVLSIDVAGIIAGSRVRGDVEERVLSIVNDAIEAGDKIIFIDEIHMIVGAGASGSGTIDIANILKPYLTNSNLRIIGATTLDEYHKYFETDSALTRRFQPINIDEIDAESAIKVLEHLKATFESYHHVKISSDAIEEAVRLSKRYIADRYLPDKAIDLIDEAAAQVKIGKEIEIGPELHDIGRKLLRVQKRKEAALELNDIALAAKHSDREKELTNEIGKLVKNGNTVTQKKKVGVELIRSIVSSWTNIPISDDSLNEGVDLKTLKSTLESEVVGQQYAINSVVNAVKRSHLGISDLSRPLASFMFLGPTGVGKSQLAKSLAKVLFGSEEMIIQVDMSEYMESHSVSKMIGSPPGYVGYQEGGQLTELVRRRPYSVILFDEVEKAHPDVLNILLQILNDGHLQDSKGRRVSFKNTIIILTSNIGADQVSRDSKLGFDIDITEKDDDVLDEAYEEMSESIIDDLKDYLSPELINRIDEVIVFRGLNEKDCIGITNNEIEKLKLRLIENGIILEVAKDVVDHINTEGYSKEYGGRNIKRKVQEILENSLADYLIEKNIRRNRKVLLNLLAELTKDKSITYKKVVKE